LGGVPPLISFDEALALGALTDHEEIGALIERVWEVRTQRFGDSTDLCSLVNEVIDSHNEANRWDPSTQLRVVKKKGKVPAYPERTSGSEPQPAGRGD
jgi:hypothetical protein